MYYRRWYSPPTVGELRFRAFEQVRKLRKAGKAIAPVEPIPGTRIAKTFWGKAWCENLLHYSDFENRMPRGRKYVRSGSVVHLAVEPGSVRALVNGTDLYQIQVGILPVPDARWAALQRECAGEIGSLVELLSGKPPGRVMEIVSRPGEGLFPSPDEIALDCSCPDWAAMCKHAAAAMYGIGVRLDHDPGQLFTLRGVSADELVGAAVEAAAPAAGEALASEDLGALFGVEIETEPSGPAPAPVKKAAAKKKARRKAVRKKAARKKVTRKKVTRKKVTRKKVTRKKVTRKKAVRKKVTRKKAVRRKGG